jgi:hypothetical protein
MRVSHWTDFTPSSSQIDNFYGGVVGSPEVGYNAFNTRERAFMSVAYRLHVSAAHNGYHHFVGMYTSLQGVAFENACVKKDCRTGYHHININFSMPSPDFDNGLTGTNLEDFKEQSYRSSFMYAGEIGLYNAEASSDSNGTSTSNFIAYGTNSTWAANTIGMDSITSTGRINDLFVLRPTLVKPDDPDTWYDLWNHAQYAGTSGGQQMFFTGIPMAHPRFATNAFTTSPSGAATGGSGPAPSPSTTWGNTSYHPTTPLLDPRASYDAEEIRFTIALTAGSGNTTISWNQPDDIGGSLTGTFKLLASTTGYPSSIDTAATSGTSQTITHSSSFTGTYYVRARYEPAAAATSGQPGSPYTITIQFSNNSPAVTTSDTITVETQ